MATRRNDFSSLLYSVIITTSSCQWISHEATRNRIPVSLLSANHNLTIERFSYDLEMKTREQNGSKQTNRNRAIWLVYRTDTNTRGFWLVKRTLGWKNFMPENFLQINRYFTLMSYYNTIGQSNNASLHQGFLWRKNEVAMFGSFHSLADTINNEHSPKPFFKVIRKSL